MDSMRKQGCHWITSAFPLTVKNYPNQSTKLRTQHGIVSEKMYNNTKLSHPEVGIQ